MFTPPSASLSRTAHAHRCLALCLILLGLGAGCRASGVSRDHAQSSSPAAPLQAQGATPPLPEQAAVLDAGCPHQAGQSCGNNSSLATQDGTVKWFGAQFNPGDATEVPLDQVLIHPQQFHDQQVIVSGHVRRACSRRGCWMEIAPSAASDQGSCRVTFKDYGFLVPTDAAGSQARLLGKVQVTVIPHSAVQHYESEGATFASKRPDGSALEVRIVASGVKLNRET